jgi:hypothetical protein
MSVQPATSETYNGLRQLEKTLPSRIVLQECPQ